MAETTTSHTCADEEYSGRRLWAWSFLSTLSLALALLPTNSNAFSSSVFPCRAAPSSCPTLHGQGFRLFALKPPHSDRRFKTSPIYAVDTKAAEVPRETLSEPLVPELEFPVIRTLVHPQDFFSSIKLPSLNRDAIINISIIALVALLASIQVFSVDSGITRGWSAEEVAYRVPIDTWRSYNEILNMAPIQTKALTSATVYTIGDVIAQRTEGVDIGDLDRGRIGRSLAAGLIGHGPLSHVWYQVSEDFFQNVAHWTEWWSFIPKVVVDQALWGPFWNNVYILMLGVMQFQKPSQIWSDVKRTTIPLIVSGLKLWPLAHCVTYGLVPVENRLLWVDLVEILWVTILATQASGALDDEETDVSASVVKD